MKKITKVEIFVAFIIIIALGIYLIPYFTLKADTRKEATIRANAAIYTAKALSFFNRDKNIKASVASKLAIDELNTLTKNPYDKKLDGFVLNEAPAGAISVKFNDELQTVTLVGLNKKGEIVVRTVIKPPSFVTYTNLKEEDDK